MDNLYAAPKSNITGLGDTSNGITAIMVDELQRTKPWVKFIGIVSVVLSILCFVVVVFVFVRSSEVRLVMRDSFIGIAMVYLIMGILFMLAGIFQLKYSGRIRRFSISRNSSDMEAALAAQRTFWVAAGIITLIFVIILVAAFAVSFMYGGNLGRVR